MAALRAKTMQTRMPARSCHRHATGGSLRAFATHAITAANSANGNANSVWLNRIISSKWRRRRNIYGYGYDFVFLGLPQRRISELGIAN